MIDVMRDEVVVVGAGIMGAATAYALAERGHNVRVLEQFRVGHTRGSSHGRSRIVRLAYSEPEWVRLAAEAMEGWRSLERESGVRLLEPTGLLELYDDPALSSREGLDACGERYELLDAAEASRRFGLAVPPHENALFQPEAGIVRADAAHRAFLDGAIARGATLDEETPVDSLDELDADTVVVTAGPWAPKLLAGAGIDLPAQVTRETVLYFRHESEPIPSVVQLGPAAHRHVLYALHDPDHGLKAGAHHAGPVVDPDDDTAPAPETAARIEAWVAELFPGVGPPVAREVCHYTTTPDTRFVLERHGRIVVGSACSGHGFKFAPVVGQRLADLATEPD